MPDKVNTITIDSILGGHTEFNSYSSKDQFFSSYAIDPDEPISDSGLLSFRASGYLRPVSAQKVDSATTLASAPMWIKTNPKNDLAYIYGATGSVYSFNTGTYAMADVGDLTDGGTSTANGAEYYDNYVYFARNTTVARYGPLDGTPAFTDDYWVTTLSKTALTNTAYPQTYYANFALPNHVMHRHLGKLYIADVVGNQGYLHYIQTTKTTVEGDTNNGSTYQALDFPYGWWPTDIETYGTDIAIALYEGSGGYTYGKQKHAKLSFWDTTSVDYNKVIDVEFPDPIISAIENVNGVLYVFSGQSGYLGVRISKFIGGYTFQQVAYIDDSFPPFPGATDKLLNRVYFGGVSGTANNANQLPCIWGIGSRTEKFTGLFNIMGCTNSTSATEITSAGIIVQSDFDRYAPIVGWSNGSTHGIDRRSDDYGRINQVFKSQIYRIGRPFKITKIRIPLAQAVAANMTIVPKVCVDDESTTYTLTTINNTNYPNGERQVVYRADSSSKPIIGKHGFNLELTWSGTALLTVKLPIVIEYEIIDD